jgi:membrane protein DedA with SNARE-associated domain
MNVLGVYVLLLAVALGAYGGYNWTSANDDIAFMGAMFVILALIVTAVAVVILSVERARNRRR